MGGGGKDAPSLPNVCSLCDSAEGTVEKSVRNMLSLLFIFSLYFASSFSRREGEIVLKQMRQRLDYISVIDNVRTKELLVRGGQPGKEKKKKMANGG